ncbi:MAG TPA: sulfatase [Bacteroidales bacterium]|nr:sulfatase [Bacteroidales bacterium]
MLLPLCLDSCRSKSGDNRPNILILMADDWNYPQMTDIVDPNISMPTFDRLAEEGMTFENAFVSSPSCTPSRGSFLTGMHPWQLETGVNLWGALPARYKVFTDYLEEAGYFVGFRGKGWGPGILEECGRDYNPAGKIKTSTFEEFYEMKPDDQPFLFWFNTGDPHRPYEWGSGLAKGKDLSSVVLPPIWPDTDSVRMDILDYFYEVERFDSLCGSVLDYLDIKGEIDNTVIIMTGDNGMPFPRAKASLYDIGTRAPLAIRWPGKVKAGKKVSDFVTLGHLAPTFLEIAGLEPPDDMRFPSILDVVLTKRSGQIRPGLDAVYSSIETHCGRYPMRAIQTAEYLYIRNYETERPINQCKNYWETPDGYSPTWVEITRLDKSDPIYQRVDGRRPYEELYYLPDDHYQLNNLALDPAYREALNDLRERLETEQRETNDPRFLGTFEEVFYPVTKNSE